MSKMKRDKWGRIIPHSDSDDDEIEDWMWYQAYTPDQMKSRFGR